MSSSVPTVLQQGIFANVLWIQKEKKKKSIESLLCM